MPPRRRFSRAPRAPKRAAVWQDTQINETMVNVSTVVDNLDVNIPQSIKKGLTLVRTIIDLYCVATGTGTGALVHAGIFMAHGDAVAASALADPLTDSEQAGYIWRWQGNVFTSVVNDSSQMTHLVYDLKSKRKFPSEDHELVFMMQASVSAISVNCDGLIRQLWLKP